MSPTMVVSSTTTTFLTGRLSCCPSCGFDILPPENDPCTQLLESQARIVELETQVCLLNQRLRAHLAAPRNSSSSSSFSSTTATTTTTTTAAAQQSAGQQSPTPSPRPVRGSLFQSGASRISALVYNRASRTPPRTTSNTTNIPSVAAAVEPTPAPAPTTSPPPTPQPKHAATTSTTSSSSEADPTSLTQQTLLEALERETSLRRAAENRLSATSKEVEELSAALFEQANEMVADERRARAKLEQRVGELEKRDVDKKRRLDRLETAVVRIERARTLLLAGPEGGLGGDTSSASSSS